MKVVKSIEDLKNQIDNTRQLLLGEIGFVPTMGALHQGHFSLISKAKNECNIVICSIFVNPTQFNNPSDLSNYPRTLEQDLNELEELGCDIVFIPEVKEMYPSEPSINISFGQLEHVMEGKHRPGHFNGVAIIVSKFFNIIKPDKAYFGQKDLQQFAIISKLVKDLSYDLKLICCDTIRENDGLAMSSRNLRLTPEQRTVAPKIFEVIEEVKGSYLTTRDPQFAIDQGLSQLEEYGFEPEYLEIVNQITLLPVQDKTDQKDLAICVAAFLGDIRLIDNILFTVN